MRYAKLPRFPGTNKGDIASQIMETLRDEAA
jgi:hypothetical protein